MSVLKDYQGPDWPLGFIKVLAAGTPVGIMSVVDPSSLNDPNASNRTGDVYEYTVRAKQIIFQALKPAAHGLVDNTGRIYIVRKDGSRDDTGTIIKQLVAGETWEFPTVPFDGDILSPYRYYIDADTADDGAIVTLVI
jgi:hypothetical protein